MFIINDFHKSDKRLPTSVLLLQALDENINFTSQRDILRSFGPKRLKVFIVNVSIKEPYFLFAVC